MCIRIIVMTASILGVIQDLQTNLLTSEFRDNVEEMFPWYYYIYGSDCTLF